jgi:hypothetical protein
MPSGARVCHGAVMLDNPSRSGHLEGMDNPWEAPVAEPVPPPAVDVAHDANVGPWRSEGLVLARSKAPWPARCVKCNAPHAQPRRLHVRYVPGWIYPTFFLGIIPFAVLWTWNVRHGVATVYVCDLHRRQRAALALVWPIAAVALAVVLLAAGAQTEWFAFSILALAAIVSIFVFPREVVWARGIEGDLLELAGTSAVFRESLPPWDHALLSRFELET